MKEKRECQEVKITVCGNNVKVLCNSVSYRGIRLATLGLIAFVKVQAELVKDEIESALNKEVQEADFKNTVANMLHDWVDEVFEEDYELR